MARRDKSLVLGSEVPNSDYIDGNGQPLPLIVRLWYRGNQDHRNEIKEEITLNNIVDLTPIRWRPSPSASPHRDMEPFWISFARGGTAANYNKFRACTITFRFRRAKPRGAEVDRTNDQ